MNKKHMKIALLNLPVDNNYGGHLQRFALITFLKRMGFNVIHINLVSKSQLIWYKKIYSYTKRFILKYFFNKNIPILLEKKINEQNLIKNKLSNNFYNKYIPHTSPVYNLKDIKSICQNDFDAYIVGSDQVWRKSMTSQIGLENYFLKFIKDKNVKRIAYAVSLGQEQNELTKKDLKILSPLYQKFNGVSVREIDALYKFKDYEWNNPKPVLAIDPTLLLHREEYMELIKKSQTVSQTDKKIYCYILDYNQNVENKIATIALNKGLSYIIQGLNTTNIVSIEQWLRNIKDAHMIITDSYHGTVFSIIFNKPFIFLGNNKRGNARIQSLFQLFEIKEEDTLNLRWDKIQIKINEKINEVLSFWSILN